jgi:hypothetical protein
MLYAVKRLHFDVVIAITVINSDTATSSIK